MTYCSPKLNFLSSGRIQFSDNDGRRARSYNRGMPGGRKRSDAPSSAPDWDWYLPEWMDTLEINQTELRKMASWNKTSASNICAGKTKYSRRLVNEAANALNIKPYELLMHPDDAMALRNLRKEALVVVKRSAVLDRTGTEG